MPSYKTPIRKHPIMEPIRPPDRLHEIRQYTLLIFFVSEITHYVLPIEFILQKSKRMTSVNPPWKYIFIIWSIAGMWWLLWAPISSLCISLWSIWWCPTLGWSIELWCSLCFMSWCSILSSARVKEKSTTDASLGALRNLSNHLMWTFVAFHSNEFRVSKMWGFHLLLLKMVWTCTRALPYCTEMTLLVWTKNFKVC